MACCPLIVCDIVCELCDSSRMTGQMRQANKDGYLERKENNAYSGLINLSFLLCTNRNKKRSIAINEIALLRRIDPFPQSPSGSVLPIDCVRDYSLLLAVEIPKGNRPYSYSFYFSGKQHGAWYITCLFAQKKKSKYNRKKDLQRSFAIHSQKQKVILSLLATLLAVIKCWVKAPEERMGLLLFTVRSIVHQCRKLMAALCPTQETEIKPALGLLFLFKLLSPRLQLWSLVDPIAWGFPSQLTAQRLSHRYARRFVS